MKGITPKLTKDIFSNWIARDKEAWLCHSELSKLFEIPVTAKYIWLRWSSIPFGEQGIKIDLTKKHDRDEWYWREHGWRKWHILEEPVIEKLLQIFPYAQQNDRYTLHIQLIYEE